MLGFLFAEVFFFISFIIIVVVVAVVGVLATPFDHLERTKLRAGSSLLAANSISGHCLGSRIAATWTESWPQDGNNDGMTA